MNLIPKRQNGGGFTSLFANYIPILSPLTALKQQAIPKASSTKDESEKGKISEKDLFSLLKEVDGLPNEMLMITNNIQRMYKATSLLGTNDIDTAGLSSMYSLITYSIKTANFNKKEYDKAYAEAEKNLGLNEVAITGAGKIVVKGENEEIKLVSISEYLNNQDKYVPITNSNLLWRRAHDASFVNNNLLFDIVNNGIGIEKVQSMIQDRFSKLGSSEQTYSGNISTADKKVLAGALLLQQLSEEEQSNLGIDGMYKAKIITKDLKQQAEQALKYIYSTLPANAQTLLALRSGDAENPTKGATEIIWSLISSQMNPSRTVDIQYDSKVNSDGTPRKSSSGDGSGDGSDDNSFKENTAMAFMNGRGYLEEVNIIPGGNLGGRVTATMLPIPGSDNNPFKGHYLKELEESGVGGILDITNATMGGERVILPELVELTEKKMYSIYWPTTEDGITPDLREGTIQDKKAADEELRNMGIDPNDILAHLLEIGLVYAKYNLPDPRRMRRFTIINARTNNNALGIDPIESTPSLLAVNASVVDQYEKNYNEYHTKEGFDKSLLDLDRNNGWFNPGDWFGNYDEVYDGMVWIPMKENYYNALASTGERVKPDTANYYDERLWNSDRNRLLLMSYVNPSLYE